MFLARGKANLRKSSIIHFSSLLAFNFEVISHEKRGEKYLSSSDEEDETLSIRSLMEKSLTQ
jgi:hypothetical protein